MCSSAKPRRHADRPPCRSGRRPRWRRALSSRSARRCSSTATARCAAPGSPGWSREIARRAGAGSRSIVVSSGAIALGAAKLGLAEGRARRAWPTRRRPRPSGRSRWPGCGRELLGRARADRRAVAGDARRPRGPPPLPQRRGDARPAAGAGAVPVINENDSVATEEIRFGDNDRLAARVAQAAQAPMPWCCCPTSTGSTTAIPAPLARRCCARVEGVTADIHAMASRGLGLGPRLGRDDLEAPGGRDRRARGDRAGDRQRHPRRARSPARWPETAWAPCSCPSAATARARPGSAGASGCEGALTVDAGCAAALGRGRQPAGDGASPPSKATSRAAIRSRVRDAGGMADRAGPRRIRRGRSRPHPRPPQRRASRRCSAMPRARR